jgi:hypothetical protein
MTEESVEEVEPNNPFCFSLRPVRSDDHAYRCTGPEAFGRGGEHVATVDARRPPPTGGP